MPVRSAQNQRFAQEFLQWMRSTRRCQEGSVYDYACRLDRLFEFVGSASVESLTADTLQVWVDRPKGVDGLGDPIVRAPSSIAKDITVLRAFYGFLVDRGRIDRNPANVLGRPKIRNVNPKPVALDQWISLWGRDDLTDEMRVLFGLGFFVGLRRAEIVDLRPTQVDVLHRRLVAFLRKGGGDDITPYGTLLETWATVMPSVLGPNGADSFLVPFHDLVSRRAARPRLLPWREQMDAGRKSTEKYGLDQDDLSPDWVNMRFKGYFRFLKVQPFAWFTPHQLRHSTATYLIAGGVPIHLVSRLLNHSSIAITMRYVKAGGDELGDWLDTVSGTPKPSDLRSAYRRGGR